MKKELIYKHDSRSNRDYIMVTADNGLNYVPASLEYGALPILHLAHGNTKTGNDHILTYGHCIPLTCKHDCECFSLKDCYGCTGNYVRYPVNQLYLADNLLYYKTYGWEAMAAAIIKEIKENNIHLFRWFTVGDIPDIDFIKMMYTVGKACNDCKFWGYTKKYMLVNHFIEKYMNNDVDTFLNCTGLIFSHWMNRDHKTYYTMLNPYNIPTSEFIPYGMEYLVENIDHICPCSNPDVFENCCNCSNPCYELKKGQSMALLEHSTNQTKERDKKVRAAHKALMNK